MEPLGATNPTLWDQIGPLWIIWDHVGPNSPGEASGDGPGDDAVFLLGERGEEGSVADAGVGGGGRGGGGTNVMISFSKRLQGNQAELLRSRDLRS